MIVVIERHVHHNLCDHKFSSRPSDLSRSRGPPGTDWRIRVYLRDSCRKSWGIFGCSVYHFYRTAWTTQQLWDLLYCTELHRGFVIFSLEHSTDDLKFALFATVDASCWVSRASEEVPRY